jgi:hypothetical protein
VRKEAADWRRRRQALRVAKRVKATASTSNNSSCSLRGVNFLMAAAYAHGFSRGASITGTQPKLLALSRSWHRRADACSLPRVAPVCGSSSTFACPCDDSAIEMVRFVALAVQRRVKNGALPSVPFAGPPDLPRVPPAQRVQPLDERLRLERRLVVPFL